MLFISPTLLAPFYRITLYQFNLVEDYLLDELYYKAGKVFINPCDNNFYNDMKNHYYKKPHLNYTVMLKAIIDTYFEVKNNNILYYF